MGEMICPVCGTVSTTDSPLCPIDIVPFVPRPSAPPQPAPTPGRPAPPTEQVPAEDLRDAVRDRRPPAPAVTAPCADPDCPHGGQVTTGCVACGGAQPQAQPRLRFPWGEVEVPDGEPLAIGRENSPLAAQLAPYTNVGRRHAQVAAADGQLTITDLDSTNGTFVNEVRLAAHTPRVLHAGDELRFAAGLRVSVVA